MRGWLGLVIVVTAGAVAAQPAEKVQRYEFVEAQMGTRFRIVLCAPDETVARAASRAAFDRIAELNRIMSDYLPTSELMRICKSAGGPPAPVGPDLFSVLQRAEEFSRLTDGAFDVTIGPVVRLWRHARKLRELPTAERIAEARALVDYRLVTLDADRHTVRLQKPGMVLDLGGIAKGYAAEEAQKVLKAKGIQQALVAAGGDIVVSAPPPGQPAWRIGITPLGKEETGTPTLPLHDCAVSTSGDAEQYVEVEGQRYAHIVDPKTGIGLTNRIQVTVVAPDGTTTDAMATALCVLGPEKGLDLVERLPRVSARFVWKDTVGLHEKRSKGFPELKGN